MLFIRKILVYEIDVVSAPIFNRSIFDNVVNVGIGKPFAFPYFGTKYNDYTMIFF